MGGAASNPDYAFDFGTNSVTGDLESALRASPLGPLVDVIGVEGIAAAFGGGASPSEFAGGMGGLGGSMGSSAILPAAEIAGGDASPAVLPSAEELETLITASLSDAGSETGALSAQEIETLFADSPIAINFESLGFGSLGDVFAAGGLSAGQIEGLVAGSPFGAAFADLDLGSLGEVFGGSGLSNEQVNTLLASTPIGAAFADLGLGNPSNVFDADGPSAEQISVLIGGGIPQLMGSDAMPPLFSGALI